MIDVAIALVFLKLTALMIDKVWACRWFLGFGMARWCQDAPRLSQCEQVDGTQPTIRVFEVLRSMSIELPHSSWWCPPEAFWTSMPHTNPTLYSRFGDELPPTLLSSTCRR